MPGRTTSRDPDRRAGFAPIALLAAVLCLAGIAPALGQQAPAAVGGQGEAQPAQQAAPAGSELGSGAVAALREGTWWRARVRDLIAGINAGEQTREDADALYKQLNPVLRVRRKQLTAVLVTATSPDTLVEVMTIVPPEEQNIDEEVEGAVTDFGRSELVADVQTVRELRETVRSLYQSRLALLPYLTPGLRDRIFGPGRVGATELRREVEYILLDFRFRALTIPREIDRLPGVLKASPLPFLIRLVELIIVILVFRWWRGWAPTGIRGLQEWLLGLRPRRRTYVRLARTLWYLERLRHPLEWMVFLALVFALIQLPISIDLAKAPWIIVRWFLLAWFLVSLITAFATRRGATVSDEIGRLRTFSSALIATWAVLLGMALEFAVDYAGRGTLYAWIWLLFQGLALLLLLLLVALWRRHVFEALDAEPLLPDRIEALLAQRRGLKGYVSSAIGGVYLISLYLRRLFFEAVGETTWGRRLLANLFTQELARGSERRIGIGEPIPAEIRDRLFKGSGGIVDKAARSTLARLVEMIETGGIAIIVSERGGGKTTFLNRLGDRAKGKVAVIDCQPDGYHAFRKAFATAVGVKAAEPTPESFGRALKKAGICAVAFDNFHRLVRPVKGGQVDLHQAMILIRAIGTEILWVLSVDRSAWRYIYQLRAGRIVLDELMELPAWTEDELEDLIELRSTEAGIVPDFTQLALPRQNDEMGHETTGEHNQRGFVRFLWHASDGNPAVALLLWADSLMAEDAGRNEVRLPKQATADDLERLEIQSLLVLRVIAQSEFASRDDIVASLRIPDGDVEATLSALRHYGWIELRGDRYRIAWPWWRTITRVLARKNLLPRRL